MSGRSFASGSVRSCGGSVRLGAATAAGASAGRELVLDALYERKSDNKSVRVLTVIVYVFCVSLAAIMLSLYYVFFWEPKEAHYAQRKVSHTVDQQTSTTPMPTCFMPHTGGSNITVSEDAVATVPTNITSPPNNTSGPPASTPETLTESSTSPEPYETTDVIGTSSTPNETNVT